MAAASSEWKIEGKNISFWLQHTDKAGHVIHGGTVIVAALATIALVGCVLLAAAQQGNPLGALNSWAKTLNPTWLYAGAAISGVILLLDAASMAAIVRLYLNQTFSRREVESMGLSENIQETLVSHLQANQYALFIQHRTEDKPAVYAVLTKDKQVSLVAFKREDDLRRHLLMLERLRGYTQAHEANLIDKQIYEVEEVARLLRRSYIDLLKSRLKKESQRGFYAMIEVYIDEWQVYARFYVTQREEEPHFFFYRPATYVPNRNPVRDVSNELRNLYNKSTADAAVSRTRDHVLLRNPLQPYTYVTYETEYHPREEGLDPCTFYGVSYKLGGLNTVTDYFLSEEDRTEKIRALGLFKN